jgi:DNA-binding GntR family transcriptional regulator
MASKPAIDVFSPVPAYEQLAGFLRDQIQSGRLGPGEPLPSERFLQEEYEVARGTARHAVEVLRSEGLVVTVQGRGTFVRPDR